jgi:endothelin-converting enzyme
MSDFNRNLLHSILEGQYADNVTMSVVNRSMDKANFEKMKLVYSTCMNEDVIKSYGVTPVRNLLTEFETVFPVDGAHVSSAGNGELTKAIIWLARHSISGLVSSGTGVSLKRDAYSCSFNLLRLVTVERPMI